MSIIEPKSICTLIACILIVFSIPVVQADNGDFEVLPNRETDKIKGIPSRGRDDGRIVPKEWLIRIGEDERYGRNPMTNNNHGVIVIKNDTHILTDNQLFLCKRSARGKKCDRGITLHADRESDQLILKVDSFAIVQEGDEQVSQTDIATIEAGKANIGQVKTEKAIAKELIIHTDIDRWPDFVFKDSYQMMSLVDVDSYIKLHGQLPDIPSREAIKNEGLSIGEIQAKLLQKIEELTLYLIEQEKRINELDNRLEQALLN